MISGVFVGVPDPGLIYVGVPDLEAFTLIALPATDHAPRRLLTKTATVPGVGRDVMIVFQHWKPAEEKIT